MKRKMKRKRNTSMPRKKSIETINAEIEKTKSAIDKVQKRYNDLLDKLKNLEDQKRNREMEVIMAAYKKSSKSLSEIMIFLQV